MRNIALLSFNMRSFPVFQLLPSCCTSIRLIRNSTFRYFRGTLFHCEVNHDCISYLNRRVVDDLMTSSSTRKICFDSQKIVRYLVETTHYDVKKGNVCLLQTYITSVLRHSRVTINRKADLPI